MISHPYAVLDETVAAQESAHREMIRLGKKYPESKQFMKMPGIGPVGAHVFNTSIQTAHRFATKQKPWKYCKLGIVDHGSEGNGRTNGSTMLASVNSRL